MLTSWTHWAPPNGVRVLTAMFLLKRTAFVASVTLTVLSGCGKDFKNPAASTQPSRFSVQNALAYNISVTLDKTQYLAAACEQPVISVTVLDDNQQPVVGAYVEFILNSLDNPKNPDFDWDSLRPIGYLRTNVNGSTSTPTKSICTTGNGRSYAIVFPPSGPDNNGTAAGGTYFSFVAGPVGPPPGPQGEPANPDLPNIQLLHDPGRPGTGYKR